MAKLPHTERDLVCKADSDDMEDGNSTDMGDDPNENNNGCLSCSACCMPSKNKKHDKH